MTASAIPGSLAGALTAAGLGLLLVAASQAEPAVPAAQVAPTGGAAVSQELTDAARERVVAEALAFLSRYNHTLYGDDEAAIRGLFVADERFAWFTDGALSYGSADDVLTALGRYAGMTFATELSSKEVTPLSPSLAAVSTAFDTTLTIPGADDYTFGGVITWLLERSPASGTWRVLRGHTSTPGGPPGGSGGR